MDAPDGFRFRADHDSDWDDVSNVNQEGPRSATFVLDADAEGERFDLLLEIETLPRSSRAGTRSGSRPSPCRPTWPTPKPQPARPSRPATKIEKDT